MAKIKASKKKRVGGFDRSKLNANFMANQKSAKDVSQGWAFDFSNPDAGTTTSDQQPMNEEEDALIQIAKQASLEGGPQTVKGDKK